MELLYAIQEIRTPALDAVMATVTELGGELVYIILAMFAFWCYNKSLGYYMLTMGFSGIIVNQFLKITCRVPRPWVKDPTIHVVESARLHATGYSFPSGHTQNVVTAFGTLARWFKPLGVRIVCVGIILVVAFTRLYLGVHTTEDVLVSLAIGAVMTFAFYPVFRDAENRPKLMYGTLALMVVLSVAYLLYIELWNFPTDIDVVNLQEARDNAYSLSGASLAMLISYHIDRRYIRFETKGKFGAQAVKLIGGFAIVVAIMEGLDAPLTAMLGESLGSALRYFILILFATGLWPATFRKINRLFERSK